MLLDSCQQGVGRQLICRSITQRIVAVRDDLCLQGRR